jgi:hypothetical protein
MLDRGAWPQVRQLLLAGARVAAQAHPRCSRKLVRVALISCSLALWSKMDLVAGYPTGVCSGAIRARIALCCRGPTKPALSKTPTRILRTSGSAGKRAMGARTP